MRNAYRNQLIDYCEGECEFVKEFDAQIHKYGAVVYNHEYNSYQYIKNFEEIDFKRELYCDLIKVEDSKLPKAMEVTIHYAFNPETEDDLEILELWEGAKEIEFPTYEYQDEDGEIYENGSILINPNPSHHTIWILDETANDCLADYDLLLISPILKYLPIARELISNHSISPFES